MNSPNILDINILLADFPLDLSVGPEAYHCRTSWNVGRHCNADFEVHILLSGSCVIEIGNQEIPVSASNAVFIPPGIYHSLHNLSDDFEWFCFDFTSPRREFSQLLCAQLHPAISCVLPTDALIICRMILRELGSICAFRDDSLRSLFTQLLVITFRSANLELFPQVAASTSNAWRTAIIDDFFSLVSGPLGTKEELAARLNLSHRQLNRVLIQKYGMGFRQKMFQTRMEYAGYLLQTTSHKIGTIGSIVGYSEESSFYKAFQSYYYMTPCQYRESQKAKNTTYLDQQG